MAHWSDNFIGLEFKPDGRERPFVDCWGLTVLIYRERLGIALPEHKGVFPDQSIESLKRAAREYEKGRLSWLKVDAPQEYDVIMLRTGAYIWHVGVVLTPATMIHIMSGINSVVEPFTGLQWKNRVQEFRRYAR